MCGLSPAVFSDAWARATGQALLAARDAPVLKLHGDMPQAERTAAFLHFHQCPVGVLLCTGARALSVGGRPSAALG